MKKLTPTTESKKNHYFFNRSSLTNNPLTKRMKKKSNTIKSFSLKENDLAKKYFNKKQKRGSLRLKEDEKHEISLFANEKWIESRNNLVQKFLTPKELINEKKIKNSIFFSNRNSLNKDFNFNSFHIQSKTQQSSKISNLPIKSQNSKNINTKKEIKRKKKKKRKSTRTKNTGLSKRMISMIHTKKNSIRDNNKETSKEITRKKHGLNKQFKELFEKRGKTGNNVIIEKSDFNKKRAGSIDSYPKKNELNFVSLKTSPDCGFNIKEYFPRISAPNQRLKTNTESTEELFKREKKIIDSPENKLYILNEAKNKNNDKNISAFDKNLELEDKIIKMPILEVVNDFNPQWGSSISNMEEDSSNIENEKSKGVKYFDLNSKKERSNVEPNVQIKLIDFFYKGLEFNTKNKLDNGRISIKTLKKIYKDDIGVLILLDEICKISDCKINDEIDIFTWFEMMKKLCKAKRHLLERAALSKT